MALTVTPYMTFVAGDRRVIQADITFDNSYRTGGLSLLASDLGITGRHYTILAAPSSAGHTCPYDYTNFRLLAFNGTTQIANTTDLSTVIVRVVAIGKGPGL